MSGSEAAGPKLSIIHGPSDPPLIRSTFGQLLRKRNAKNPRDIALISQHQNEVLTYADLHRRSDDLAAGLIANGIKKGDRVAVMLGSRTEYVDLLFACAKLGALVTLLNYAYTPREIVVALRATSPKVLFTTLGSGRYEYKKTLVTLQRQVPCLTRVVLLKDIEGQHVGTLHTPFFQKYGHLLRMGRRQKVNWTELESKIRDKDVLNLQFTSGSTGAPKAAALTHHGMMNSAQYIGLQMKVKKSDRILVPVPLFHAFGLIIGLCTAFVASASIVLPSEYFDAGASLRGVEKYQCTGLYGVTTMFIDELCHPGFSRTKKSSLKFGVMAGSAMPEDLLIRVMTKFPIPAIYTNWGMTELSSIATMTTASDPIAKKMKTAGQLLPHFSAKVVHPDTGIPVLWGSRGEIVISGFGVMDSYFNDIERTRVSMKVHSEDEALGLGRGRLWMHTGDEGCLDADGYFVITGRIKDLIIRGGENIAPLEIEERLFQHPAIKQASVFGIPHPRYGEEVAAFLELEDAECNRPTDEEVREWVRGTLSRFKAPVRIWWLGDKENGVPDEWPKTANGKLRKKDVREIALGLMKTVKDSDLPPIRPSL